MEFITRGLFTPPCFYSLSLWEWVSVNSAKLSTIEQYAEAVGYNLEIKFTQKKVSNK